MNHEPWVACQKGCLITALFSERVNIWQKQKYLGQPFQKQPPRGVSRKGCSETCCKFTWEHPRRIAISKQLYWNHTLAWMFSCYIFSEQLLLKNTSGGLLLSFPHPHNPSRNYSEVFTYWTATAVFCYCVHLFTFMLAFISICLLKQFWYLRWFKNYAKQNFGALVSCNPRGLQ